MGYSEEYSMLLEAGFTEIQAQVLLAIISNRVFRNGLNVIEVLSNEA